MIINYPLSAKVFQTESDYKEALQAVKNRHLTVDELQLLITYDVKQLYNSLVASFFGTGQIDHNNIYKRETVLQRLTEHYSSYAHLFHILTSNGLIGICGRGYTFDAERFKHDEEEHMQVSIVNFHKGFSF